MSIRKTVGGDRLGSGNKLTTELHGYGRSTHDVGKITRTSMTTGTLVPVHVDFIQKGDVMDIDLEALIRTHPTNGPIFGSYKLQVDVFTADIRLYNKQLHNNTTGIGMRMNEIIFPEMVLNGKNPIQNGGELNIQQIAPDSLLAYLGIRGLGTLDHLSDPEETPERVEIRRNATPLLMYWEIVKEYYSNKQEERGFVIGADITDDSIPQVDRINVFNNSTGQGTNYNNANDRVLSFRQGGNFRVTLYGRYITRTNLVFSKAYRRGGSGLEENVPVTEVAGLTNADWYSNGTQATLYFNTTADIIFETTDSAPFVFIRWNELEEEGLYKGIRLVEFPLKNIDDMREKIFSQPKTSPLTISYTGENAVNPYLQTVGQQIIQENAPTPESNMRSYFPMSGLGIKTYQSDRYNNWLSKTWVENINDISSVQITGNSFTMDALNLAKKVYELENRIAVAGGTYQDWLEAVYGEKTSGSPEMPVYRGGMSAEIIFEEVVSSSDATTSNGEDQPLGTLGGQGKQVMKKGGKIRVRAEEHGYLMVIASLTPRIDYHQGNKWWTKLKTMDDIHKPQLDNIGFQELLTDEMAAWDTVVGADGTETFHSVGKQPSWTHYMTNTNEVYGNFARENAEQWMTLTRRYEWDDNGLITDATTYIDPAKFNYPFAYIGLDNQPFWAQFGIEVINRRLMSANQMPNL